MAGGFLERLRSLTLSAPPTHPGCLFDFILGGGGDARLMQSCGLLLHCCNRRGHQGTLVAPADYAGVVFIEPAGWLVWGAGTSSRLNAVTNSPQRVGGQQGGGLKRRRLEHRTSLIPTYPGTLDNRVGRRRAQLAAEDPHKGRCFVCAIPDEDAILAAARRQHPLTLAFGAETNAEQAAVALSAVRVVGKLVACFTSSLRLNASAVFARK